MRALITGIGGQDGSYLAELLLNKGYEVFGIVRGKPGAYPNLSGLEASIKLIDRWAMDALIPNEKELAILMRWEGRLTRELRLDMLHLEQMQRQRRDHKRLLSFEQPESNPLPAPSGGLAPGGGHEGALAPAEEPESQPPRAFAEWNPTDSAERPAQQESLGDPVVLRTLN